MRRLTILFAAVGALLLVPAAQAFANGTIAIGVEGNGSGEVVDLAGGYEGNPPVACAYTSPGPATGTCSTELGGEPGDEGIEMEAIAAPGSELGGWVKKDPSFAAHSGGACPLEFLPLSGFCAGYESEAEEPAWQATAIFCIEGTAIITEEIVDNSVVLNFGGCEEPTDPKLTVIKEGTGSGTVVSNPTRLVCGAKCEASFPENSKVTLTASPEAGSTFVSWKGCEKGGVNGRQCTVTMDKAKTVNAKFLTAYDVTVSRVGSGLGKVSSSPGGVLCLSNCASTKAAFKEGTSVTLTAAPSKNYVFTEWTGACTGSSPTCSLGTLSENKTVGAKFTAVAQHNLTVKKIGGGNGTVKSNLAGINCGATCSSMAAAYFQGQVVELTATPGKGSTFGGWSGSGGCTGTGTCTVTMSAGKTVEAEFK